jgi:hypothetical protein
MAVQIRSHLPKSLYLLLGKVREGVATDCGLEGEKLHSCTHSLNGGAAARRSQFFGLPGLVSRNSIQLILKVDEGKQDRQDQIESKADRLTPVVMIEQLFANLEDYNDPQKPGEEKPCGERSKCPVEG